MGVLPSRRGAVHVSSDHPVAGGGGERDRPPGGGVDRDGIGGGVAGGACTRLVDGPDDERVAGRGRQVGDLAAGLLRRRRARSLRLARDDVAGDGPSAVVPGGCPRDDRPVAAHRPNVGGRSRLGEWRGARRGWRGLADLVHGSDAEQVLAAVGQLLHGGPRRRRDAVVDDRPRLPRVRGERDRVVLHGCGRLGPLEHDGLVEGCRAQGDGRRRRQGLAAAERPRDDRAGALHIEGHACAQSGGAGQDREGASGRDPDARDLPGDVLGVRQVGDRDLPLCGRARDRVDGLRR